MGSRDWMGKRLTIGLLTTRFADGLERALLAGAQEAAETLDVNLVAVVGGRLRSPNGFESSANVLYDLVRRERIDGFVIRAGSLGVFAGRQVTTEFCLGFGMPFVTSGASIPGVPRVLLDSYAAMRTLVSHL